MSRLSRGCVVLLILGSGGCHGAPPGEASDKPSPVTVTVAKVQRTDIRDLIETSGELQPLPGLDAKLGALVVGRIRSIVVAEGDRVTAGQVLALIDAAPLTDALRQAEAALVQSQTQQQTAASRLERARRLLDAGIDSRQDEEDARTQDATAVAGQKAAAAAVDTARTQLGRATIRAPFTGVVAHVFVAPGEPVDGSGKPIIEVAQTNLLEVHAGLTSAQAVRVKPGMKADVTTDGLADTRFEGQVVAVSPMIDPATGVAVARIRLSNPQGVLKAGSFARATLIADIHRNALAIPRAALVPADPSAAPGSAAATAPAVEVVHGGKAQRTAVTPGYSDGALIEVKEGLSEGQEVIVQGAYALPDGTPVAVQAPDGGER